MTQAMTMAGKSILFPSTYQPGEDGAISAPDQSEIDLVASSVRPEILLLFADRLVRKARKQSRVEKYRHVNPARLELARKCLDHALREHSGEHGKLSEAEGFRQ